MTTPGLRSLSLDTAPVPLHGPERIWAQTNCYLDLWIEIVGRAGRDIRPVLGSALAAGTDTSQWSFVKPDPGDLRDLLGITVGELNIWRDLSGHVTENLSAGVALSVEVDSYWLPDTAGVGYRQAHGKTSIVPVEFDPVARTLVYLHNAGCHRAEGDDIEALFSSDTSVTHVPFPYVEQIRIPDPLRVPPVDRVLETFRRHLRAADESAAETLAGLVETEAVGLAARGPEWFHLWSFGTLRAVGSTAEVCADLARWLVDEAGVADAADAVAPFVSCAEAAKSVQFRLARAAQGRTADAGPGLTTLAGGWSDGISTLRSAIG